MTKQQESSAEDKICTRVVDHIAKGIWGHLCRDPERDRNEDNREKSIKFVEKSLKSYRKEVIEQIEKKLKDLEDYEYTRENALVPIGEVLDLLQSLK